MQRSNVFVNIVEHNPIPENQSSQPDIQDVTKQIPDLPNSDTAGVKPKPQLASHSNLFVVPTLLEQHSTNNREDTASSFETVQALRQNLDGQILQEPSESSPTVDNLETILAINLEKADGGHLRRLGKLDTGADVNLICTDIVRQLGIKMKEIHNAPLRGVGNTIIPEGIVTITWNVVGKAKTYTDDFFVVNEEQAIGFDCLIGEETINRVGFLKRNHDVYWFEYGR